LGILPIKMSYFLYRQGLKFLLPENKQKGKGESKQTAGRRGEGNPFLSPTKE
jgi:hypothetical protein